MTDPTRAVAPSTPAAIAPSSGERGLPAVDVRGVTRVFQGRGSSLHALGPVDLRIDDGEVVAIVGASGCGKSTLLNIVGGLDRPTAGTVEVHGSPVTGPVADIGIAFQKDLLLPWRTILDNVLLQVEVRGLDRRAHVDRAHELLALVGLQGFDAHYPSELSGGMRQRVAVCRALLHDPSLLLMDEPFGALDALTRDQIALDFQALAMDQRKSVLLITHSVPEAVFLADRVLVMTPRPGTTAELLDIDLPRPRRLQVRESPAFTAYEGRIRAIFERHGVLRTH